MTQMGSCDETVCNATIRRPSKDSLQENFNLSEKSIFMQLHNVSELVIIMHFIYYIFKYFRCCSAVIAL